MLLSIVAVVGLASPTDGETPSEPGTRLGLELRSRVQDQGSVRVLVHLAVPAPGVARSGVPPIAESRRVAIAAGQTALESELAVAGGRITRAFSRFPYASAVVTPEALEVLAGSERVLAVHLDRVLAPSLDQSIPLVGGSAAIGAGFDGAGVAVAVLDTGVDAEHAAFGTRVLAEVGACFSTLGSCPNLASTQLGVGSADPCSFAPSCAHGTHVAGIVASADATYPGVAPSAAIIPLRIFSELSGDDCDGRPEDPCALAFESDLLAGLEHVLDIVDQYAIAAVNLSLGGFEYETQAACKAHNPAVAGAIDDLRAQGVVTVAAGGNDGFVSALNWPACLPQVLSVGATTLQDGVWSDSNSVSFLGLLAPGVAIDSALAGSGFGPDTGTSMANAHVSGAVALLHDAIPVATAAQRIQALRSSGTPVTDSRNGLVTPRLRIDQAILALDAATADCGDGADNDGDGWIDHPDDPGCATRDWDNEAPDCDDGQDNDDDGWIDQADSGCIRPWIATESPECSDGIDNDGDARIDFDGAGGQPDPHCEGKPFGNRESPAACGLGFELMLPAVFLGLGMRSGREGTGRLKSGRRLLR